MEKRVMGVCSRVRFSYFSYFFLSIFYILELIFFPGESIFYELSKNFIEFHFIKEIL